MMLALGLVAGSGATLVLRLPSVAIAQQAMGGMDVGMKSKSAGDTEMNDAMNRMMHKMSKATPTGFQDRDFMMMMIPHHQSAIDMAKVELRRGTHPQLKALARDIINSQDKEILQMQVWLKAWYRQGS